MFEEKQKIPKVLVVEDNLVNRIMLRKILSTDYEFVEAENGKVALNYLEESPKDVDIVILDLQMPVMTGVEFLEKIKNDDRFNKIPIIIATTNDDVDTERHALELGAIDYISKPYNPLVIRNRLKMIFEVGEKAILQFENERDQLTKIFNKKKFFQLVENKIAKGINGNNFIITFDIENFKLFNELYGMQEGDELLCYIAETLSENTSKVTDVFCRLDRDNFAVYLERNRDSTLSFIRTIEKKIKQYNLNYSISIYFGIYEILDTATKVNTMCDRANMAISDVKGLYAKNVVFYSDAKRVKLLKEQELLTDMMKAFDNDEYQFYIQPKVNMATGEIIGGEALARWISEKRGFVLPGEFIPLAEKSRLITKIDFCIWRKVCAFLRKRLDEGKKIVPISINISRVELYNKSLIVVLNNLVRKYNLNKKYLIVEITETVYMENPEQMVLIVQKLQEDGYLIHMDDFGSGYSSLNMLNELKFDVIKLDLRFMTNINAEKKSENIVGFIMNLASWLNVDVIAEGVETRAQMEFLRSIGCIYGQGYLLGRPAPTENFEELLDNEREPLVKTAVPEQSINLVNLNDLWDDNSPFSLLFQTYLGGICLIENNDNNFNLIRGNDAFYSIFGIAYDKLKAVRSQVMSYIVEKDLATIDNVVKSLSGSSESKSFQLELNVSNGLTKFIQCNAKTIFKQKKYLYYLVSVEDITEQKQNEQKDIRLEIQSGNDAIHLLSQDKEIKVFKEQVRVVSEEMNQIIFDFDYKTREFTFLAKSRTSFVLPPLDCKLEALLSSDYVQESFKEEMVNFITIYHDKTVQRKKIEVKVKGVSGEYMWVEVHFIKQYDGNGNPIKATFVVIDTDESKKREERLLELSYYDSLTKLFNRKAFMDHATICINDEKNLEYKMAMAVIDVDNFKLINDSYGHDCGDKVLQTIAKKLSEIVGQDGILGRIGGDEFILFFHNTTKISEVEDYGRRICQEIKKLAIKCVDDEIACSIGFAILNKNNNTFKKLYNKADKALYIAKNNGKNTWYIDTV